MKGLETVRRSVIDRYDLSSRSPTSEKEGAIMSDSSLTDLERVLMAYACVEPDLRYRYPNLNQALDSYFGKVLKFDLRCRTKGMKEFIEVPENRRFKCLGHTYRLNGRCRLETMTEDGWAPCSPYEVFAVSMCKSDIKMEGVDYG